MNLFDENPDVTDFYGGPPTWADLSIDATRNFSAYAEGIAGKVTVFSEAYNVVSNTLLSSIDIVVASRYGTTWHVAREATGLAGAVGGGIYGTFVGTAVSPGLGTVLGATSFGLLGEKWAEKLYDALVPFPREYENYAGFRNPNNPWLGPDTPAEHGPGPGVRIDSQPFTKADPDFDHAGFRDPGKQYSGYDTPAERGPGPGQQAGDRGGERGDTPAERGPGPGQPLRDSGSKAPFAPEPPPSRDWAGGHLKGFEDDGSPVYAPPHTANKDYGLDSPRERIPLDLFPKLPVIEENTYLRTATSTHDGGNGPKPILIDLDGDGLEIVSGQENFVLFDTDDTGLIHRTSWAGQGDGVLFFDADRDGTISSAREFVFTEWDPTAGGDMQALRNRFDSNGDGRLSACRPPLPPHLQHPVLVADAGAGLPWP